MYSIYEYPFTSGCFNFEGKILKGIKENTL